MREISLWAYHSIFGTLCSDARLGGKNGTLGYPDGTTAGQAGWQIALKFSDLSDLATQLNSGVKTPAYFCGNWYQDCDPIARGEVKRLAILAHGLAGQVLVNGENKTPLTADNIALFHSDLYKIGLLTDKGSMVLFMGCLAGQDTKGTRLLQALSREWPGRTVVAFSTLGYRHPGEMKRRGEACEEPGMRDTNSPYTLLPGQSIKEFDPYWSDLTKLPWASHSSPHAKVVQDGAVLQWPVGEKPLPPSPPPPSNPAKGSRTYAPRPH